MAKTKVLDNKQVAAAKEALLSAFLESPDNYFVRSCAEFFKSSGFLTKKQIKALQTVEEPDSLEHYDCIFNIY